MPLYEYQCENCGEVFELMQKFSDEPTTTHQKCGGKVHRLISAPALQFKGSGWYITDYAKSGSSSAGSTAKKDDSSGSSSKDSSKDSSSGSSGSASSSSSTPATSNSTPASTSDKK